MTQGNPGTKLKSREESLNGNNGPDLERRASRFRENIDSLHDKRITAVMMGLFVYGGWCRGGPRRYLLDKSK
jgi:hypothetical protein